MKLIGEFDFSSIGRTTMSICKHGISILELAYLKNGVYTRVYLFDRLVEICGGFDDERCNSAMPVGIIRSDDGQYSAVAEIVDYSQKRVVIYPLNGNISKECVCRDFPSNATITADCAVVLKDDSVLVESLDGIVLRNLGVPKVHRNRGFRTLSVQNGRIVLMSYSKNNDHFIVSVSDDKMEEFIFTARIDNIIYTSSNVYAYLHCTDGNIVLDIGDKSYIYGISQGYIRNNRVVPYSVIGCVGEYLIGINKRRREIAAIKNLVHASICQIVDRRIFCADVYDKYLAILTSARVYLYELDIYQIEDIVSKEAVRSFDMR